MPSVRLFKGSYPLAVVRFRSLFGVKFNSAEVAGRVNQIFLREQYRDNAIESVAESDAPGGIASISAPSTSVENGGGTQEAECTAGNQGWATSSEKPSRSHHERTHAEETLTK